MRDAQDDETTYNCDGQRRLGSWSTAMRVIPIIPFLVSLGLTSAVAKSCSPAMAGTNRSATGIGLVVETCEPTNHGGLIVDLCETEDDVLREGLVSTLSEEFPGKYSAKELECVGDRYLELNRRDSAILASAAMTFGEIPDEVNDVIARLFIDCGAIPPFED